MNNAEFIMDFHWVRFSNTVIPATFTMYKRRCTIATDFYKNIASSAAPFDKVAFRLKGGTGSEVTIIPSEAYTQASLSADGGALIVRKTFIYKWTTSDTSTYQSAEIEFYKTVPVGTAHATAGFPVGQYIALPNSSSLVTELVLTLVAVIPLADQAATFSVDDNGTLVEHDVLIRPVKQKTFNDYFNYALASAYDSVGGIGEALSPFDTPGVAKSCNLFNISSIATPKLRKIQLVSSKDIVGQTIEGIEFSGYKYKFTPPIIQGANKSFNLKFQQSLEDGAVLPFESVYPSVIGEWYQGGFFAGNITYGSKTYALIVKPAFGSILSATLGISLTASGVDDGYLNTTGMSSTAGIFQIARRLYHNEWNDWYIPSQNEMLLIYNNLNKDSPNAPAVFKAGGPEAFAATFYFISTKPFSGGPSAVNFGTGAVEGPLSTTTTYRYMLVRRVQLP